MRYRDNIDPDAVSPPETDGLTLGSALYALVLGVGMVLAGIYGRQRWVSFWGASLAASSAAYLFFLVL